VGETARRGQALALHSPHMVDAAVQLVAWDQVLTLLSPLPVILLANLAERQGTGAAALPADVKRGTISPGWVGFVRAPSRLGWFTWGVLLVVAAAFLLLGAGTAMLEAASHNRDAARGAAYGLLQAVAALAAGAVLWRPVRQAVARLLPMDPDSPVHTTALFITVLLFGTQAAAQLSFNVLATTTAGQRLQPLDLVVQEVPFLLAALVGVGIYVRRDPAQSLRRLGLVRPRPWQLLLALAAAGLFYAFSTGVDQLAERLTPDLSRQVGAASQQLFGQLQGSLLGIATIALAAGICEETLFRGALQPRMGLVWTALVFTAVHTEYGLSLDAAAVLVLAVALGLIRRYANTTTSATCHVAYNAMVGASLVGVLPAAPAAGLEVLLLAGAAGAWLVERGRGRDPDRG
jgi:CAAX protease family protein